MLHFRMDMPLLLMALYGSIFIIIVLLLRSLFKNRLPKFVFPALWILVLIRLLIPFSLSSPLSAPVPDIALSFNDEETAVSVVEDTSALIMEGTSMEYASAEQTPIAIWESFFNSFLRHNFFFCLFVAGFIVMLFILLYQKYHYLKKLRCGLLIEHNETINALLREKDMGYILVFTNDKIASPLVSGILNPRIHLPTSMDFQNTELLRHIFTHETIHVRHKDNWIKLAMLAALCLNWYNPLVWLMSKCLSSDLEAFCDASALKHSNEEQRKNYALSLLSMAVTGNRSTLLYSAFSKTEVEKRIKGILHYKKVTAFTLLFSVVFMLCGMVVFATGGQAPFSSYLTGYCFSSASKWGVQVEITRDIYLGENAIKQAENAVLAILSANSANDPDLLEEQIKTALSGLFSVEKNAFRVIPSLCLDEEEIWAEYEVWELIKKEDGLFLYQGEPVRTYSDKMLGSYQSRTEGTVDISIERNRLGEILSITAWREGDSEFDRRTREIEKNSLYFSGSSGTAKQDTVETISIVSDIF